MTTNTKGTRSQEDIAAFEAEQTLDQRIPATILDLFESSCERFGDRIALTMVESGDDDEDPRRLSYRDLVKSIRQTSNLFAAVGHPGAGVAYLLPTLPETQITLWAAETAGYAVPLNPLLQVEQLVELIQTSGAKILVTCGPAIAAAMWEKGQAIHASLPDLTLVCIAAPSTHKDEATWIEFESEAAKHAEDHLTFKLAEHPDRTVAYFHTGGTTGVPKLVAHTHRNQLTAALGAATLLNVTPDDVITNGMPLFHVGGAIVSSLALFLSGANVLTLSAQGLRNPVMVQRFWKIVERHDVTIVGAVPTAFTAILEGPVDGKVDKVRFGITGSAPTPRSLVEKFTVATGRHLHEILGMTESGGATAIDPTGGVSTAGSVGIRLPYTKLRVFKQLEGGRLGSECAAGEVGVLVVSGPTVSPGYLNHEQNEGVFNDGSVNSGDLARIDEDGKVYICGRAKDVIIRSGHNIDPAMIEAAFTAHPDVLMAAAVGQPDAYAGELPVCYVSLSDGATVDAADLLNFGRERIAERPAWPKSLHIMKALPLTAVGKIYKPTLRADAAVRVVRPLLSEAIGPALLDVVAGDGDAKGLCVEVLVQTNNDKQSAELILSKFTFAHQVRALKS